MATSRLQRKVAREGEGAYGNLLESFVTVGTPLPSLAETSKDGGEFKPLWEQEAVDEKGRRRFHGAFTGGFSAGYGGTVGSKEGWTPSTFKSSRANRASEKGRSTMELAQDLMDEEDLAELKSSRTLATSETYAAPERYDPLLGTTAPSKESSGTAALASLIQPASSRIGAQLMRKMGWRDGQGVGPRVTLAQRREQAHELGQTLPNEEEEEGDGEASKHYYAPLDRPLVLVPEVGVATDRGWGLGYKSGPTLAKANAGGRYTSGPSSIGISFDEDEGQVYDDGGPSNSRQQGIVDFDDEDEVAFGRRASSSRSTGSKVSQLGFHLAKGKLLNVRTKWKQPSQTTLFHDGTRLLPGFSLVHEPTKLTNQLVAPPRNWQPNPAKLWAVVAESSTDGKGKGRQLDAEERGTLLGEKAPTKSVFDYLSQRDKERLATMKQPPAPSEKEKSTTSSTNVEPLPPPPARPTDPLFPGLIGGRLTKGPSTMLAGRFTSSRTGDVVPKVAPGLFQPAPKPEGSATETPVAEPLPAEKATIAQEAARSGDFGVKTRTVENFRPNRLLCKRFGVPDPWEGRPEEREDGIGGVWKEAGRAPPSGSSDRTGEVLNEASMEALMQSSGFRRFQPPEDTDDDDIGGTVAKSGAETPQEKAKAPSRGSERPTLATVGLGDDETQGVDTLTYTKTPKDIFAAIFADSDDEDEDEEEKADDADDEAVDEGGLVAAGDPPLKDPVIAPPPPSIPDDSDTVLSVDTLSSYRPSFVKSAKAKEGVSEEDKSESKKKSKRKKRPSVAPLSFEVEDDGGEIVMVKPMKKKPRTEEAEKPKKAVVEPVQVAVPAPSPVVVPEGASKSNKRSRAADLFD